MPARLTNPKPESVGYDRAIGMTIALGLGLRLLPYFIRPSLWLDEATLALNIVSRSYRDLLLPLEYKQVAPIPFLWGERFLSRLAGVNEFSLRALPLAAGCALLFSFRPLARRFLSPAGAFFAMAIAAVSPSLIAYSNQVKPFAIDPFVGVLLALAALRIVDRPDSRRDWVRLTAIGAAALLVSIPAPFTLAGIMGALLIANLGRRSAVRWSWFAATGGIWAGVFGGVYFFYRGVAGNEVVKGYMAPRYLTLWAPGLLPKAVAAGCDLMASLFTHGAFIDKKSEWVFLIEAWQAPILLVLALVGVWAIYRRFGTWAVFLLAGPTLTAVAASSIEHYPIVPRLMLYAAPMIIVLTVSGIETVVRPLTKNARGIVLKMIGCALLSPPLLYWSLTWRQGMGHNRQSIERFQALSRPGEAVYIYYYAIPTWTFYTTDWSAPDRARLDWIYRISGRISGPSFLQSASRGKVIHDEGNDLVYNYRGRREIFGIADGYRSNAGAGSPWNSIPSFSIFPVLQPSATDAGWIENEARRIRMAADPSVWLFASLMLPSHYSLLSLLEKQGGRSMRMNNAPTESLYRFSFGSAPAAYYQE